jgi:DNA-binding CsgD family transcriptional regulator
MDAVEAAAFVLDGFGQVIATSAKAAEHLGVDAGLRLRAGRLTALDARDDAALQAAIRGAVRRYPRADKATQEVAIRRPTPGPISVLRITPLPEHPESSAMGAAALVVARHSLAQHLTAAERAILAMLVEGRGIAEIAELRGASRETVRSQLKFIYAKAEVSSRGELLALYARGVLTV